MAKRKPAAAEETALDDASAVAPPPPAENNAEAPQVQGEGEHRQSRWLDRFPQWADQDAGVTLTEDRVNRRMTIKFSAKPSEAARTLMKSEPFKFRYDAEDQLWFKRVSSTKPRQSRGEAEELAYLVAKVIREENGLPPKEAFSLAL